MSTKVKPFSGVVYNKERVGCYSKIICPPYDVITPPQVGSYRKLSQYNLIHLSLPEKITKTSKYQQAHCYFQDWIKKGILIQDTEPAIYLYQQEYRVKNRKYKRLGFIGGLNLNNSTSVYGHEHTRLAPIEDRYRLLEKIKGNIEPIFVLFSDKNLSFQKSINHYIKNVSPCISFKDTQNNSNMLWRISSPQVLRQFKSAVNDNAFFIADGHHRFEVSLRYQSMMRKKLGKKYQGSEDFNFIMAYFCPLESPGLIIRPIHRLVRGIPEEEFLKLKEYFLIKETTRHNLFSLLNSQRLSRRVIGAYDGNKFFTLTLKNQQFLNKIDKDYRCLDICMLNELVLKEVFGLDPKDNNIEFSSETEDLIHAADMDKTSLVFFLKATKIKDIIYLARKGKKFPAKTTYFYPKVPSGLVMYKFK